MPWQSLGVMLILFVFPERVQAPYGMRLAGATPDEDPGSSSTSHGAQVLTAAALATATATVTAVAAERRQCGSMPRTLASFKASGAQLARHVLGKGDGITPKPVVLSSSDSGSEPGCGECNSEEGSGEELGGDSGAEHSVFNTGATAPPLPRQAVKLWTNGQFPEGVRPMSANWDMANLQAAQAWTCPCPDRANCIAADRGVSVLEPYEYHKNSRPHAR